MANPTIDKVIEGGKLAREEGVDLILGVGGGSVMDASKAIGLAAVTANYYRRIYDASAEALSQFGSFATNVWGIEAEGKSPEELALAGIDALDAWTHEVGAPRASRGVCRNRQVGARCRGRSLALDVCAE